MTHSGESKELAPVVTQEQVSTAMATRKQEGFLSSAMSVGDVVGQVRLIQDVMKSVMKDGEHYGKIPGCPKPSLFKAGAEKLCMLFRLDPQFSSAEIYSEDGHLTVKSKCTLSHINSGTRVGSGEGSCSTKETRYAFRDAAKKCPKCGNATIIKGKAEYGGGWLCYAKKGGCGAKFGDNDKAITGQPSGKVPTENLADEYNTILKMANKRALVAACLVATAASDIFTQDVEDLPEFAVPLVVAETPSPMPSKPVHTPAPVQSEPPATVIDGAIDAEFAPAPKQEEPPKPRKPVPAPKPPDDGSSNITINCVVTDIKEKTGQKANGEKWTLYGVKLYDGATPDGFVVNTFSDTLASTASTLMGEKAEAVVTYRVREYTDKEGAIKKAKDLLAIIGKAQLEQEESNG